MVGDGLSSDALWDIPVFVFVSIFQKLGASPLCAACL